MNSKVCFLYVYGVWISDNGRVNFKVHFLYVYRVWISDNGRVNFEVCFLYVCRVWISDNRRWNSKVCFLYVFIMFMGYEFLTTDGWISRYYFYMFTGYEFLMKDEWLFKVCFSSYVQTCHFYCQTKIYLIITLFYSISNLKKKLLNMSSYPRQKQLINLHWARIEPKTLGLQTHDMQQLTNWAQIYIFM